MSITAIDIKDSYFQLTFNRDYKSEDQFDKLGPEKKTDRNLNVSETRVCDCNR